jgi:rhodanese-related sulfurtransferase
MPTDPFLATSNFAALVAAAAPSVREVMPWDVDQMRRTDPDLLVVDVREADEFAAAHIAGSLHVPRGVLEAAFDWGYPDTVPALARARRLPIVLVCRSGSRTVLAAQSLQQMGFSQVMSMKTGVRGWNDFELPLVDAIGQRVDGDTADALINPPVRSDQLAPKA